MGSVDIGTYSSAIYCAGDRDAGDSRENLMLGSLACRLVPVSFREKPNLPLN